MKTAAVSSVIASLVALQAGAGTVTTDGPDLVINTKGGFSAETADGAFAFGIGGRAMLDYNSYDGVISPTDGTDSDLFFRRARVEIDGKAYDWAYLVSYNLIDEGSIDQLHMGYEGWGDLVVLTFGQQKEDFGLEDTGSSKWITGIERSMPSNAFDTGNNLGIKLHGSSDRFSYSLGVFKTDIDDENELDTAVTGRAVFRPLSNDQGLVHLGAGFTSRTGVSADYNSRLGVRGGDDGDANRVRARISGETGDRDDYNLEAAAVFGPFHAMAEYFDGEIDVDGVDATIEADGYYVQAGWVLTGESRSYKNSIGAFDKVKPSGDLGAWEVFARYDNLDLSGNSAPISVTGEEAESWTLGINWYINPLMKAAVDYVSVDTDESIGGEDDGDAVVGRLQIAF